MISLDFVLYFIILIELFFLNELLDSFFLLFSFLGTSEIGEKSSR